jgi:fructose-1-phosphate kinase PfkB-like protein
MPAETYARIVKLAHEAGASVAIDCAGDSLMNAIEEKPELVKINRKELAATLGRPLRGQASVIAGIRELRRRGAGLIVVSDGPRSGLALDAEETIHRALPPKPHKGRVFGAGDIMLAGLVAELIAGKSFVESFKEATSRAADAVGKLMQ